MEPWYRLAVVIILPLMTLLFRRRFSGAENLPRTGGVILAANHISVADPFAVALFVHATGRRPRFMAKASVFRIPLLGRIVKGARQIPVYRESADPARALSAAVAAVEAGECVVVYPEGTVTKDPDHWPMVAKTGVARIALRTGAPVVPVGQWGAQRFIGRDGKPRVFPRKKLYVRAGAPVDLSPWQGAEPSVEVLRAMTSKIMGDVTAIVADLRGETPPTTPYARPRRLEAVRDDDRRSA